MPARGPHRVHYVILSGGGDVPRPLSGGVYHLLLRGPGRFDAWIVGAELGPTFGRAHLDGPFASVRSSVTIPATAPGILAVGELVSRTRLRSDDAELETPGAIEGEVAPDASVGPARHGAPKPDLVAPGGWLVAARSGNLRADASFSLFGGSRSELRRRRVGDRVAVRGSSFAAPVAAGALALALELHPSRGAQDRALLRHTAARLTEAAWTASSGFGRLDVAAFLRARERLSHTEERASVRTLELALTRPALSVGRPSVFAVFRADAPTEATIAVAGPAGRTEGRLRAGTGAVPLGIPTALPGRSARFEAFVDGRSVATWDMPTRVDAARATVGTPGGGGCVVVYAGDGRPSRGPGAWLVAAWVAVVVLRRRRRSCVASETAEPPPRMRRSVG
jgi:subtilisin family serine protease